MIAHRRFSLDYNFFAQSKNNNANFRAIIAEHSYH